MKLGMFGKRTAPALAMAGVSALLAGGVGTAFAQQSPQEAAPIDLTGQWVAVVTEDWRWRMVVPPRGDYSSVPLTEEGRRVADTWDPERDAAEGNACKAYGAGAIMRMPTRVRIDWTDDDVLRINTDAGTQTRNLRFGAGRANGSRTLQGHSVAEWDGTQLKVTTTNLSPGYLRRNGVPYSEDAVVTEYYVRHSAFGDEWFTVTTVVEDPEYLREPFITSSSFKREEDRANWSPGPCISEWGPLREPPEDDPFQ